MAARNQQQLPELEYLPSYTQRRAPPPSGAPPAYSKVLRRVYPYSLRPAVVSSTFVVSLYLLWVAVSTLKEVGNSNITSTMKIFDILVGVLMIAALVIEVIGLVGAFRSNIKLATLYSRLSIPAVVAVIAAQVLRIVAQHMFQTRLIDNCVTDNTGAVAVSSSSIFGPYSNGSTSVMSQSDAQEYCNARWKSDASWQIVWLVVSVLVGFACVVTSFDFVRQLLDPSSVPVRTGGCFGRNKQQAPSAYYGQQGPYDPHAQSQAYGRNSYPPAPYGAYAPPSGPPPQEPDYSRDLPKYERGNTDISGFDDQKSPADHGYATGRPSTSRDRAYGNLDAAKDSQVTVKLDDNDADPSKKAGSNPFGDDDDNAPRI